MGITAVSINGLTSYSLSTANNASDQARYLVQQYTGALTGDCTVTIPNELKIGWAQNSTTGGFNVRLSAGAGASIAIPDDGNWYLYFTDGGTNVVLPGIGFTSLQTIGALNVGANLQVVGDAVVDGTLDVTSTFIAHANAFIDGAINIGGDVAILGAGTALQVPNGLAQFNIIQTTGAQASAQSGWIYNSSGGGAASGTFNFGIEVNSYNCVAAGYFAVSDARLKSDIETIPAKDGEEFVRKARPVTYVKGGNPEAGLIAQEQVKAGYGKYIATMPHDGLPETIDEDGFVSKANLELSMNYDNALAFTIAALKSALSRIEALEKARGAV